MVKTVLGIVRWFYGLLQNTEHASPAGPQVFVPFHYDRVGLVSIEEIEGSIIIIIIISLSLSLSLYLSIYLSSTQAGIKVHGYVIIFVSLSQNV